MIPSPASSRPLRVSVCMASYCGSRFIREQIESILAQLADDDELVIVDDASTDDTVEIIRGIADPRIRLIEQTPNRGYVRTFERALTEARGEILLLSDQDDVWAPGRVAAMTVALADADVVASNLELLAAPSADGRAASTGRPIPGPFGIRAWRLPRAGKRAPIRNTLGVLAGMMPYFGCAMGFRRSAAGRVLPFPEWLFESHDLWLALVGNLAGTIAHLDTVTTYRRLHDSNTSPAQPRSLRHVLRSRLLVARMIGEARRRART